MFDEPTPPQKGAPVEDIFAQASPPSSGARPGAGTTPVSPLKTVAPTTSASAEAPITFDPEARSRRWLLWLGIGVLIVAAVGGGVWFWLSRPSSPPAATTETETNETTTPETSNTTTPSIAPAENQDIDGDGLSDAEEQSLGTDPRRADSDEDGLFDREEIMIYKSNPLLFDTDGDGFGDGQEVQNGYSPTGAGRLLELPAT